MQTKKYHYNTSETILNKLKALAEYNGIKQTNTMIDYLVMREYEKLNLNTNDIEEYDDINIEEYTRQLNQVLLNGTKKDLEQFILDNNISLSNYEYFELLQMLHNRETF